MPRLAHRRRSCWRPASAGRTQAISRQYAFGPPLYLLAFGAAFFSAPVSVGLCLFMALFFAFRGGAS
jgi:hypothetical protein